MNSKYFSLLVLFVLMVMGLLGCSGSAKNAAGLVSALTDLIKTIESIIKENGPFFFWSIFTTGVIAWGVYHHIRYIEKSSNREMERLVEVLDVFRKIVIKNYKSSEDSKSKDSEE